MVTKARSIYDAVIGDDGCHLHDVCLTCPLPMCFYDGRGTERAEERQAHMEKRDAEIVAFAMESNATVKEIAARFGVSRRTVARALQGKRP